jgi:hypothetical protein
MLLQFASEEVAEMHIIINQQNSRHGPSLQGAIYSGTDAGRPSRRVRADDDSTKPEFRKRMAPSVVSHRGGQVNPDLASGIPASPQFRVAVVRELRQPQTKAAGWINGE